MILSDRSIIALQARQNLIDPFDPECVQPASYDLHLGHTFLEPEWRNPMHQPILIDELPPFLFSGHSDSYVLASHKFALATTMETVYIPNDLAAKLEGKSSLARIGLFVHITAGFVDPGFRGELTIEMFNASPYHYRLLVGMPIAQIAKMVNKPAGTVRVTLHRCLKDLKYFIKDVRES